jgi:hypothetical protein
VNLRPSDLLAGVRVGLLFVAGILVSVVFATAATSPATLPDLLAAIESGLREVLMFAWPAFFLLAAWVAPFERPLSRGAFATGAWGFASIVVGIAGSIFQSTARHVEYGTPLEPLNTLLDGISFAVAGPLVTAKSAVALAVGYVLVARFGGVATK